MSQLQLKPDIVEDMIQWLNITILIVPHGYWNKIEIEAFCSMKVVKLERNEKY